MTIDLDDYIGNTLKQYHRTIEAAIAQGYKSSGAVNWVIDELKDYLTENITKSKLYGMTLQQLKEVAGPTIYWVEIKTELSTEEILEAFKKYRFSRDARNTPTCKWRTNCSGNILYVGKVQRDFWGRVIQHLGFSSSPQTQGLQLFHWIKGYSAEVTFHYREFIDGLEPLIGAVEYNVAKEMNPILGTHR